jgi:hypothetical protein
MNTPTPREEFEEWLDTVKYDNSNILSPSGLAWEAWQAAQKELTAAREEIERLRDHCRIKAKALINQTSERMKAEQQRGRLAEAVNAATILIAAKGRHNTMLAYEGLRDVIQSLNQPTQ